MLKLAEVRPDYCPSVTLYKWISPRTGLQLVLVRRAMPVVNGYFAVATEINDNSGCPHTLEHLVFMGSQKYPYKGLLDILGSKLVADTNAWTGQDQTVYTLNTAGWEGFKKLLPVYMDHILNPTIKDAACLTEVFHEDDKGKERGVVFSEMQAVENNSISLITEASQNLLYEDGSGYRTNTGGLMDALRALQPETIRQYHSHMYRPSNLCILVTGDVDPESIVSAVEDLDKDLKTSATVVSSGQDDANLSATRPFIDSPRSQVHRLKIEKRAEIEFPDKNEEFGELQVSWIGPEIHDLLGNTAIQVLGRYLSERGAGKLYLEFVGVENALAGYIYQYSDDYLRVAHHLMFQDVPTDKLDELAQKIHSYISTRFIPELDIEFLSTCAKQIRDQYVLSAENDPETFQELIVGEFLYGERDGSTFSKWTESTKEFETLLSWSRGEWVAFIEQEYIQNPSATVLARPSDKLYSKLKQESKDRVHFNRTHRNGVADAARLAEAELENSRAIPPTVLDTFSPPDLSKINFITSQSAATGPARLPKISLSPLQSKLETSPEFPLAIHFESYESEFVAIRAFFSVQNVDNALIPLLPALLESFFDMPMELDDGTRLTAEEVAQAINVDTLESSASVSSVLFESLCIRIDAHRRNYDKAVKWLELVVGNVVWDSARIGIFLQQHLSSLAERRRSGSYCVAAIQQEYSMKERSLSRSSYGILTEDEIQDAAEDLDATTSRVQTLLRQLFTVETTRILVMGNLEALPDPLTPFDGLHTKLKKNSAGGSGKVLRPMFPPLSDAGISPSHSAKLVTAPGTESAFVAGMTSGIAEYDHADIPVLQLTNSYLRVVEGPLWRAVRGSGLAYDAHITARVSTASLEYSLYRCSDVKGAMEATRKVISDLASGKVAIDPALFVGAQGSIANRLAQGVNTPTAAASQKFVDYVLADRDDAYAQKFIKQVQALKPEDIVACLNRWHLRLFDATKSMVFVSAHPSQRSIISDTLENMGYEVEVTDVSWLGRQRTNKALIDAGRSLQSDSDNSDDEGDHDGSEDREGYDSSSSDSELGSSSDSDS